MFNAGHITTADAELNQAIWALAPTWTNDATALAHYALRLTGNTGPTVNTELLEQAAILAQEALDETRPTEQGQEPIVTLRLSMPFDPKVVGRTLKALEKVYRFSDGTCTLKEKLERHTLTRRSWYTQKYSRRKRRGFYEPLKNPRTEYTVWYITAEGNESGIDVPKIVYDALLDVPKLDGLGSPQGEPS